MARTMRAEYRHGVVEANAAGAVLIQSGLFIDGVDMCGGVVDVEPWSWG